MSFLSEEAIAFIERAASQDPDNRFAVRLPDGSEIRPGDGAPRFTLVLKNPESMLKLMASADLRALGEAYLRDDIDVEGDMEGVYPLAEKLTESFESLLQGGAELSAMLPFQSATGEQRHTVDRDAEAIEYHYDQSNAVFDLVTDPTMNYSSAYFYAPDQTLEQAQINKMDTVCRKAGLNEGDRVLDIGCGWGAVLSHAAGRYGVDITGVTISKAQHAYDTERMKREGLSDRARAVVCDYREIDESKPFDKIISLGMVEHVGVPMLPTYFEKAFRLLEPGGVFVLQGVSSSITEEETKASDFADAYLFPDADMPYLHQYLTAAEEAGFEVRDVENLREHYALTHRKWRENLERNRDAVIAEIGRERYRALRVLYSYSTHYFHNRKCSVYQFVLWKPQGTRPATLPWKRPT